jgi:hypothetical protein
MQEGGMNDDEIKPAILSPAVYTSKHAYPCVFGNNQ